MKKTLLKNKMLSMLLFVCLTSISITTKAQIFKENFVYSAGDSITNPALSSGWTRLYGTQYGLSNTTNVSNGGLTYTNYPGSGIGNALSLNNIQAVRKTFTPAIDTLVTPKNVYLSFLVRVADLSLSPDSNYYLVTFNWGTSSTPTTRGRLWVKRDATDTSKIRFGASKSRNISNLPNSTIPYAPALYNKNQTYLIVIKYRFNGFSNGATDDQVSLWVNPQLGSTEDPNPVLSNLTDTDTDLKGINGVVFYPNGSPYSSTGGDGLLNATIDGIRIDTSWANLLPNNAYYFYKGTGRVDSLVNWGTNSDGSGTHPTNFTNADQIFYVTNTADATLSAPWTVSGSNSKIIVNQNTNFNIIGQGRIGNSKIDVETNASITTDTLYSQNWGDVAGQIILKNAQNNLPIPDDLTLPALNNAEFILSEGDIIVDGGLTLTVAGKLEIVHPSIVSGAGTFSLEGTGTLRISSPEGIVYDAVNFSGAVQTNQRFFDSAADYTYNGTGSNLVVGDGLPNNLTGTLSLDLLNSTDVLSLSRPIASQGSASGCTLNLTSGRLSLGNYNIMANSIINGGTNSYVLTEGTGSIIRYMKSTSTTKKSFYIGNSNEYRKIGITFPSGSGRLSKFTVRYNAGNPGQNGYPSGIASHYTSGYWSVKVEDSIPLNTFTVEVEADGIVTNMADARILKRESNSSPWAFAGSASGFSGTEIADSLVSAPATIGTTMEFTVGANSAVLPVRLTQFSATKLMSTVDLNWKVTTENALSFYQVERSANGKDFTAIGMVKTTNAASSIVRTFNDGKPLSDNYYRLKLIDQNGTFEYSQTVRVRFDAKAEVAVYPTISTNGMFNIQLTNQPKGDYNINITNSIGQNLQRFVLNHQGQNSNQVISLSKKYGAGIYNIVITSPAGNQYTNRVIIK